MSASYFQVMFAYNRWAWSKVLDMVQALPEDEYTARQFNFGSIRSTLIHAAGSEASYLARISGKTPQTRPTEETLKSSAELRAFWEEQFEAQETFAASLTDAMLGEYFSYTAGNGQQQSSRRDLFLAQLLNHSTQHRAETAMAVTEFGHSPGDLDVFIFVRENKTAAI